MAINLGALGDSIYDKADEIVLANAKVKALEVEKRGLEERLLNEMTAAGTAIVRGVKSTVTITESVRPQIADFEAFEKFVLRKKALYLFERRVAAVAYREMKESMKGKAVPGISEFVQQKLSVRKL